MDHQKTFNKIPLHLTEKQVIEFFSDRKEKDGLYDMSLYLHLISPDLEFEEYYKINGLYIAHMIPREELGFAKNKQPGDFDIVIIPYSEMGIHFERTGVYEVKVVRPTVKKPTRNANSLGITQVNGLITDGFPFVGLMHISITEPLPEELKQTIKLCTLPVGDNTKFEEGKTLEDYTVDIKADHFSWYSVDKQLKRLISAGIPKHVALDCYGLNLTERGNYTLTCVSTHLQSYSSGYFNPHATADTIKKIRNHFITFRDRYIDRPVWKPGRSG
jgi:hypothetical protein